jgi:hypothetical protein
MRAPWFQIYSENELGDLTRHHGRGGGSVGLRRAAWLRSERNAAWELRGRRRRELHPNRRIAAGEHDYGG